MNVFLVFYLRIIKKWYSKLILTIIQIHLITRPNFPHPWGKLGHGWSKFDIDHIQFTYTYKLALIKV